MTGGVAPSGAVVMDEAMLDAAFERELRVLAMHTDPLGVDRCVTGCRGLDVWGHFHGAARARCVLCDQQQPQALPPQGVCMGAQHNPSCMGAVRPRRRCLRLQHS